MGHEEPTRSDGHGGPDVGEMMLNVAENVPSPPTVTRPEVDGAGPQLTGIVSLRAVKVTVGWLLSLLHSSRAPTALAVNPEPVTATLVPPLRHVPGLMVRLGEPPDVADCALHGWVVVVVVVDPLVDVVVVDALVVEVVVDALVVVVVVVAVVEKAIGKVA